MDTQMTTHAHPDRAYGNIVRPMSVQRTLRMKTFFLQVYPDRVHVRNVEDQPLCSAKTSSRATNARMSVQM